MAAKKANEVDIPRINNKPQYKNQDFSRDTPFRQKYYKEHQDAFMNRLDEAAKTLGTNASGTKKYKILEGTGGAWNVVVADVKHAVKNNIDNNVEMRIIVVYTEKGFIKELLIDDDFVVHSDVETFYSTLWGQRNALGCSK